MIEKNCENVLAARDYIAKLKEKPYTTIERKYGRLRSQYPNEYKNPVVKV